MQDCFSAQSLRNHLSAWRRLDLGQFAYNTVRDGVDIPLDADIVPFSFNNPNFSANQCKFIQHELSDLLNSGVIERCFVKPVGVSPIRPIPKKGGKFRLIINLRHLNSHCSPPKFQYEDINSVMNFSRKILQI